MRKTAAILLFLFGLVQVAPAVYALFTETIAVFAIDEERAEEKMESENKVTSDFMGHEELNDLFSAALITFFQDAHFFYSSPRLEKATPPPNFC